MSPFWWAVVLVISQVVAVAVFLASTFGLAVFCLYLLGRFEYKPWR